MEIPVLQVLLNIQFSCIIQKSSALGGVSFLFVGCNSYQMAREHVGRQLYAIQNVKGMMCPQGLVEHMVVSVELTPSLDSDKEQRSHQNLKFTERLEGQQNSIK